MEYIEISHSRRNAFILDKTFIENNTFKKEIRVKEELCMFCVINPPRQGKSLLLDQFFLDNEKVLVIEITYNSNTSFLGLLIAFVKNGIKVSRIVSLARYTTQMHGLCGLY